MRFLALYLFGSHAWFGVWCPKSEIASEQEKAEPAAVQAERAKGDGKEVDLEAGPSDAGQDMTQFFEEVKP